ncbi:hypothetical protein ACQKWADRAFT_125957 [Trichoderma austrokoningii]
MTGECGDIVLMYPLPEFSTHTQGHNQPLCMLEEPFDFNQLDPREYSLIEKKMLKELGVEALPDWKIPGMRETLTPGQEAIHEIKELELRRLERCWAGG